MTQWFYFTSLLTLILIPEKGFSQTQTPLPVSEPISTKIWTETFQILPGIGQGTAHCALGTPPTPTLKRIQYQCSSPNSASGAEKVEIELYHSNDNLFLGLVDSGNDLGNTTDFSLKAKSKVRPDLELSAQFQSELYTKRLPFQTGESGPQGIYESITSTREGQILWREVYIGTIPMQSKLQNTPIRLIDVSRWVVSAKKGNQVFYSLDLGVEKRNRTRSMGASIQDKWHQLIDASIYDYHGPEAQAIQATHTTITTESFSPYSNSVLTNTRHLLNVDRLGFDAEKLNTQIYPWAGILGVGIGKRETLVHSEGKCEVVAEGETKANLVFEGSGLGQNSRISNRLLVVTKVRRITATGTFEAEYFLTPYTGSGAEGLSAKGGSSTRLGKGGSLELALDPSKKNSSSVTMIPFIRVKQQGGRMMFQEFNDADAMMDIGFRLRFH